MRRRKSSIITIEIMHFMSIHLACNHDLFRELILPTTYIPLARASYALCGKTKQTTLIQLHTRLDKAGKLTSITETQIYI